MSAADSSAHTAVTLRALQGEPLADPQIRDTVLATAHAIAERQGINLVSLTSTPASVTATLAVGRIPAIGFAAELRRLTTRWYTAKFHEPTLWGHAADDIHDPADDWKNR
ncbi:MAG TPA: hypothetical protein VG711_12000 [Phycisphaerales bacterium]|nr:hypothetical protein [Phycisphaerales bacterium]